MTTTLLKCSSLLFLLTACVSSSHHSRGVSVENNTEKEFIYQPFIDSMAQPQSLMSLAQTQYGGFILKPGFYETEFKTYCLQPGTPDPAAGDAYLQSPVTGYRKDIVESVLVNSRDRHDIDQKNIQLLLWSVVSGSDFNKLSFTVQSDAVKLLTPKQIFELKGGIVGAIKTVSYSTGIFKTNNDIRNLFERGIHSYETFERLAVRREPAKIIKKGVRPDQWYKQDDNYYVRYFPVSYKKVKIQVFVPDTVLDADDKRNGEYVVFDPTGYQATPAFTNAQRLGIGSPVPEIVRVIIQVNNKSGIPKRQPEKKGTKTGSVTKSKSDL